jgi:predicted RecB family nuclease
VLAVMVQKPEIMLSNELIKDFIFCKYKYLRNNSMQSIHDELTSTFETKRKNIKNKLLKHLSSNEAIINKNCSLTTIDEVFKSGNIIYLHDATLVLRNVNLSFDFIEVKQKKPKSAIPIFIHPYQNVSKEYKLLYITLSHLLSNNIPFQINKFRVICSEFWSEKTFRVNNKFAQSVIKSISAIDVANPEKHIKKTKHCQSCSNWIQCKEKLIEKDDLSLLGNISPKEIKKYNEKGIFTINQLSYTFRPRRVRKTNPSNKGRFRYNLRALAIREKRTLIQKIPTLKKSTCSIFFDFESIPDAKFIYLIGLVIIENKSKTEHSFWANNKSEEEKIFADFFSLLYDKKEFTCYHYGNYELKSLHTFNKNHNGTYSSAIDRIENSSVNLLSFFYSDIQPPTLTNGLKDIARYIGFEWTSSYSSGVQCLKMRYKWEEFNSHQIKGEIELYNLQDCLALILILEWIREITTNNFDTNNIVKMGNISHLKYGHNTYSLKYFKGIEKYAYFDYQRSKVYLKTSPIIKRSMNQVMHSKRKPLVNKFIDLDARCNCPKCFGTIIYKHDNYDRIITDLKFMRSGIKKWVIRYRKHRFRCKKCGKKFYNKAVKNTVSSNSYGRNLMIWVVHQNIASRIPIEKINLSLKSIFKISIENCSLYNFKYLLAEEYRITYESLLIKLISGRAIHADETSVSVRGIDTKGYVWILTSMDTVAFIFRETREVSFLKEMLISFEGTLITDFYPGYDSINCKQQKCLVHLIRDLNDDLFKHPLNADFEKLALKFGEVINTIVSTVNNKGLKTRFLHKHEKDVNIFYRWLESFETESDLFFKYRKRFLKNKSKLFHFMTEDGIPWNNNNAEHGIKHFAAHRKNINGLFTLKSIDKYLVLLSIYQTCSFRGIDFLEFLKSGEKYVKE